jgi:hypothetical protein
VSEFVPSQITGPTLVCMLAAFHTLILDHVKELYEVHGVFCNTTMLLCLFIFPIQEKYRLSCFIFIHQRRCDSEFFHYFLWCSVTWYCWCRMPLKISVTFFTCCMCCKCMNTVCSTEWILQVHWDRLRSMCNK